MILSPPAQQPASSARKIPLNACKGWAKVCYYPLNFPRGSSARR